MEKLQPVIKHIFWILFSLAMLLLLIGWWMAKGALSTQIETRKAAVDKAFSDSGVGVGSTPNARWTEAATAINEAHKKDFLKSSEGLWREQLNARTFPASIRHEMESLTFGSTIEKKSLRERYAQLYRSYFLEQLKVIKPFIDGEGLVDVSQAQITQENEQRWKNKRPTSPEIWNAQEDIWLLGSVFHAIAAVNEGAERIDKAPLRSLLQLQLRGGDRDAPVGGGGGAGGFGMSGSGSGSYESGMDMGSMYSGGGPGGGGGANLPWKQYEGSQSGSLLNEEFGAVGGGMGGGGDMYSGMMGSYESGNDMSGGFGGGGGEAAEENRYVDDGEGLGYKTRAFELSVKILQQDIPALLAELTNSRFPVEIVRVDAAFGQPVQSGSQMGGMYGGMYGGEGGAYESGGAGGAYESGGGMGSSPMGMGGPMGSGGLGGGGLGGINGFGGAPGGGMGMNPMNGGFGGPTAGMGMGNRGNRPQSRAAAKKITMGSRLLAEAMRDESLSTVRIAGLMTMYNSPNEEEAGEQAEEAATMESQEAGGVDLPPTETLSETPEGAETPAEGTPADGSAADGTPAGGTQNPAIPPADGSGGSATGQPATNPVTPDGSTPPETAAPPAGSPGEPVSADGATPANAPVPEGAGASSPGTPVPGNSPPAGSQ
ncbi:MAG: hypothetical protein KDA89_07020 [Planctomycetaceae bacterium]|nr:hypothetical protein [Planctomycetaceae bacterium]